VSRADRLIRDALLPNPEVGDLMAIPVTGAYSYSTANHYNGALSPPIVLVENGTSRLVARRETYDDLLRTHLSRST
jgi:diaminopimelate decarboxylase